MSKQPYENPITTPPKSPAAPPPPPAPSPKLTPEQEAFVRDLEKLKGRKMTPEEIHLSIAQAEMIGDL